MAQVSGRPVSGAAHDVSSRSQGGYVPQPRACRALARADGGLRCLCKLRVGGGALAGAPGRLFCTQVGPEAFLAR